MIDFVLYGEKFQVSSTILHAYNPKDDNIFLEKYKIDENIYGSALSMSHVYMGTDLETGNKVAIKEMKKARMEHNYLHELARNELAIHYSLSQYSKCNNIVKAQDYFENNKAYYLIMEYSPDPNYFEDLFENVYLINIRDTNLFQKEGHLKHML